MYALIELFKIVLADVKQNSQVGKGLEIKQAKQVNEELTATFNDSNYNQPNPFEMDLNRSQSCSTKTLHMNSTQDGQSPALETKTKSL